MISLPVMLIVANIDYNIGEFRGQCQCYSTAQTLNNLAIRLVPKNGSKCTCASLVKLFKTCTERLGFTGIKLLQMYRPDFLTLLDSRHSYSYDTGRLKSISLSKGPHYRLSYECF